MPFLVLSLPYGWTGDAVVINASPIFSFLAARKSCTMMTDETGPFLCGFHRLDCTRWGNGCAEILTILTSLEQVAELLREKDAENWIRIYELLLSCALYYKSFITLRRDSVRATARRFLTE